MISRHSITAHLLVAAGLALLVLTPFSQEGQTQGRCPYGTKDDGSCWGAPSGAPPGPPPGPPPDLTGYWETPEGTMRFYQGDDDSDPTRRDKYFYALLSPSVGSCPAGGKRDWYIAGFIEGSRVDGTMMRCTETKLVTECRHPETYKIPFTGVLDISESWFGGKPSKYMTVKLQWRMEFFEIPACKKQKEEPRSETIPFTWRGLPKADDEWDKAAKAFKDRGIRKLLTLDPEPLVK